MSDLPHRVEALEHLSASSPVRMSLAQLGVVIGAIICSAWWASTRIATKDDIKGVEDHMAVLTGTMREMTTTLAVLKDRSEQVKNTYVSEGSAASSTSPTR